MTRKHNESLDDLKVSSALMSRLGQEADQPKNAPYQEVKHDSKDAQVGGRADSPCKGPF